MNKLENAASAYLRSAAHQPIDWYEFGPEAFDRAKKLDRPVLLDIGAVWCHWCHVIDRESYDDPEIAQIINENYVAVKVDRDQRPDVDARYQHVVQSMTGQGGWPLTGILTWDGRLIYGGTYFPKQAMKNILLQVRKVYDEKKSEIFQAHEILTEELAAKQKEDPVQLADLPALSMEPIQKALASMQRMYDPVNGGFGDKPKFPHFSALQLLLAEQCREPNKQSGVILETTLTQMANGGIYDQLAGGFHRYSVDNHWHVPHFEKMAYDNAEALTVYAQAYRHTGNAFYKHVATDIIRWVNAQLSDQENGGFYGSQDADIDLNDDGDHFTWTLAEAKKALDNAELEFVQKYYDITEGGDMHERPGRNVLRVKEPEKENTQQDLLKHAQEKMLAVRMFRPIPFIDNTLYTNWNGMLISAYFEAADLLAFDSARQFASKSLDRVLKEFYEAGKHVLHTNGVDGLLEDYAWLALACLKGYYSTGKADYFTAAQDITGLMLIYFEDSIEGGFNDVRDSENAIGLLKFKRKPVEDNPSSSPNAVACQVLLQLHYLTDNAGYKQSAERTLKLLTATSGNYGLFIAALDLALLWLLNPPLKLEVLGNDESLIAEARHAFYPGKIVAYTQGDKPEVRVCVGTVCKAPVTTATDLKREVENLRNVIPAKAGTQ